ARTRGVDAARRARAGRSHPSRRAAHGALRARALARRARNARPDALSPRRGAGGPLPAVAGRWRRIDALRGLAAAVALPSDLARRRVAQARRVALGRRALRRAV